jgi:hypothetical protein
MTKPWRPYSGYIQVPAVWLDDKPVDFSNVKLARAAEIVCKRQLNSGFEATIFRDGLIFFRFTGTSLDAGTIDFATMTPAQHELATSISHGRAEVLTFHSACFGMARGEATNSVGQRAAIVTPANLILCDEGLASPSSQDRGVMACLFGRFQPNAPNHIAAPLQRNDTMEWADPTTAARSLDLFDQFYDPTNPHFQRAVFTIVSAVDHLGQNEYAQAFILGWTVVEHCISRLWDRAIEDLTNGALAAPIAATIRAEGRKPADFVVAKRLRILALMYPTESCYVRAEALRALRNDFVHDLALIRPSDGADAARIGIDLIKLQYGMELRPSCPR